MVNFKITVGELEDKLLKLFPKYTACEWDNTGLTIGDPNNNILKIAVGLDPTIKALNFAKENGCNVLLTHHPAYLGGVEDFKPEKSVAITQGSLVYHAIFNQISLINIHTALDVSDVGRRVIPSLLDLDPIHILCPEDNQMHKHSKYGFGMLNKIKKNDQNLTLKDLANRCTIVFNKKPRIWGNSNKKLKLIGTTTGSTGTIKQNMGLLRNVINLGVDCLICGEIKYHDALDLSNADICIIELGHDISELPLVNVLIDALLEIGVNNNDIIRIDQSNNWF